MSDLLARFQDREETVYSAELYLLRKLAETSSDMVKARDWKEFRVACGGQKKDGGLTKGHNLRRLLIMPKNVNYRVKYWRWINEQAGEWYRTGLMTKENAEKVAESFRQSHEQVEVYFDDDGK